MRHGRALLSSVGLLASLALASCTDYVGDALRTQDADAATGLNAHLVPATTLPPPRPVTVEPFTLAPGDCFDNMRRQLPASFEAAATVGRLPCGVQHHYEVFARIELGDEAWPGSAELVDRVDRECSGRFAEFVGRPWAESSLDYAVLVPSEDRWEAGTRHALCALFDLGMVPLEGSMAGTAR